MITDTVMLNMDHLESLDIHFIINDLLIYINIIYLLKHYN